MVSLRAIEYNEVDSLLDDVVRSGPVRSGPRWRADPLTLYIYIYIYAEGEYKPLSAEMLALRWVG